MRWQGRRESANVEDRRGDSTGAPGGVGARGFPEPRGKGGLMLRVNLAAPTAAGKRPRCSSTGGFHGFVRWFRGRWFSCAAW